MTWHVPLPAPPLVLSAPVPPFLFCSIPEGVAVAMPIYYATGSKPKAFFWASLSGMTELFGAALGWVVLRKVFNELVYGILFGLISGMMVRTRGNGCWTAGVWSAVVSCLYGVDGLCAYVRHAHTHVFRFASVPGPWTLSSVEVLSRVCIPASRASVSPCAVGVHCSEGAAADGSPL